MNRNPTNERIEELEAALVAAGENERALLAANGSLKAAFDAVVGDLRIAVATRDAAMERVKGLVRLASALVAWGGGELLVPERLVASAADGRVLNVRRDAARAVYRVWTAVEAAPEPPPPAADPYDLRGLPPPPRRD